MRPGTDEPSDQVMLPKRLALANALDTERQIRRMLVDKHKNLKEIQPILDRITAIDQAISRYVERSKSERLPLPDLALMELEADQAASLEPRQGGLRVRISRPIMIALAQEALSKHESMTLREIIEYLGREGYTVLDDKTVQGGMISMVKTKHFASGLNSKNEKAYRLAKVDPRFQAIATVYQEWREKVARTRNSD